MKYSTKLSDAVHIMVFIELSNQITLTSTEIAASIQTNPAYVRQLMAKLKAAGLIQSRRGQAKPCLDRKPEEITLLDVYRAVEGTKPLLHLDTHTNPECHVGVYIQYALQDYYDEIQQEAEKRMNEIHLSDVIRTFREKYEIQGGERDYASQKPGRNKKKNIPLLPESAKSPGDVYSHAYRITGDVRSLVAKASFRSGRGSGDQGFCPCLPREIFLSFKTCGL